VLLFDNPGSQDRAGDIGRRAWPTIWTSSFHEAASTVLSPARMIDDWLKDVCSGPQSTEAADPDQAGAIR